MVLELAYSRIGDVEVLVPNTFGEESARRKQGTRPSPRWSEGDFFDALEQHASEEEAALARRLHAWGVETVNSFYWGEGQMPSCTFVFTVPEGSIQPCGLYFTRGGLSVGVNFSWMRKRPRVALERVLDELTELALFEAARDEILDRGFAKRPTVSILDLGERGTEILIAALERMLEHPAAES